MHIGPLGNEQQLNLAWVKGALYKIKFVEYLTHVNVITQYRGTTRSLQKVIQARDKYKCILSPYFLVIINFGGRRQMH